MNQKEQAAQQMMQSYAQQQQAAQQLANITTNHERTKAAYLKASGGVDEKFVWGMGLTGHEITVKGGVITIGPAATLTVSAVAAPAAAPPK